MITSPVNQEIKFFSTIFDAEDLTNICSNLWETTEISAAYCHNKQAKERLCFNALNGPRCNANVTKLRTILIEADKTDLNIQLEWLATSHLPYSAAVYSGSKSIHIFISLTEPIKTIRQYKKLVNRLYAAITDSTQGKMILDESMKIPSQLCRYPNAVRKDNSNVQELLVVNERISKASLEQWIEQRLPNEFKKLERQEAKAEREHQARLDEAINLDAVCFAAELPNPRVDFDEPSEKFISRKTRALAERFEYETESRHEAFKTAVTQMKKAGFDSNEIERYLDDAVSTLVPDRPNELRTLLAWAERNVVADEITHLKSV